MTRETIKYLGILLLAVLVFGTAYSLDNRPLDWGAESAPAARQEVQESPEVLETQPQETEPPQTEVPDTVPPQTEPVLLESQEKTFVLTFAGDCTLGSNPINYYADFGFIKTVGEDWRYPFVNVISWMENDDATLINLEGTFCDSGYPVTKAHNFRAPCTYVNILTENSVEAVTLANNHSLDYGTAGYESTLDMLEKAEVPYVEDKSTMIFTTDSGLTVGIYGSVYTSMDMEDMVAEITALKEQGVELIIYAPHWGFEKSYQPNAEQIRFGYAAIDAGAKIVWGSHPHVLQPIEEYNGGIIYYSLGNFSFGGNIAPEDYDTALIRQEIIREPDGTVRLGDLTAVPCSVSSIASRNNFQPTPYGEETEEYARVLKKLGLSQ